MSTNSPKRAMDQLLAKFASALDQARKKSTKITDLFSRVLFPFAHCAGHPLPPDFRIPRWSAWSGGLPG